MTERGPTTILLDKLGHPFVIRPFQQDDRAALDAMYDAFEPKRGAQGLPPADPAMARRWLDGILATGHHLITLGADGELVGHGMILPFAERAAELANFLHQSARDRGLGTALNGALLELARGHGIERVWLSVEPSNRRAIRSYEKVGFRPRSVSIWAPELEMEMHLPARD